MRNRSRYPSSHLIIGKTLADVLKKHTVLINLDPANCPLCGGEILDIVPEDMICIGSAYYLPSFEQIDRHDGDDKDDETASDLSEQK